MKSYLNPTHGRRDDQKNPHRRFEKVVLILRAGVFVKRPTRSTVDEIACIVVAVDTRRACTASTRYRSGALGRFSSHLTPYAAN